MTTGLYAHRCCAKEGPATKNFLGSETGCIISSGRNAISRGEIVASAEIDRVRGVRPPGGTSQKICECEGAGRLESSRAELEKAIALAAQQGP